MAAQELVDLGINVRLLMVGIGEPKSAQTATRATRNMRGTIGLLIHTQTQTHKQNS